MSSPDIHTEATFESAIIESLMERGWSMGAASSFSKDLAFDKATLLGFVQRSQPQSWAKLSGYYKEDTESKFIQRLFKELDLRGTLDVLRHGITDSGVKFRLAYFRPDSSLNPETVANYNQNVLHVSRQVFFSAKGNKSVDLLLSLNGLPIATIELKNHFTGQGVQEAMEQYRTSRDPKELLFQFKKRALVHFTVDPDEVYLTTRLDGAHTRFLPFNKGFRKGAGNPPAEDYRSYKTSYFWEDILQRDSWLEIISRFMHLQKDEYLVDGRKYVKESLLFPRYHQLDCVRDLRRDAKANGPGINYLIQHSAGSGKSNTIAWLAYRLSSLYTETDRKVFDTVIVVTDRNVLDQQLQHTIYQFEHTQGVVQRIDQDSDQLAKAIAAGTGIIITTLQKFPYALKKIKELTDGATPAGTRSYAIIIDEAHSSHGGTASRRMTEALAGKNVAPEEAAQIEAAIEAEEEDGDDQVRKAAEAAGPQPNISLFAFTATPKEKTITVFGTEDDQGEKHPFHNYSMRQAIEEGFILDVLKNYTTYTEFYRFAKAIEDDPELNRKKAIKAISHFQSLLPHTVLQKTVVMIEHFRQVTMKKIGGKAKAMVVTSSRKHALRYYQAFKEYIAERGYHDIRPLVAFSGAVIDDAYPEGITEAALNGFGEKELPGKFATDEYQILLVADKYQTGFDQPLLHTMYVDKKLSGVKAVQTLSRLNRTYPGKEDTFVLDFANDREDIVASFQPYYEETYMAETADPNHLYDLKNRLDAALVYHTSEVDAFARLFYRPGHTSLKDQGRMYAFIDPAVERYAALVEEAQDDFSNTITTYVRLYSLLVQIMPFQDVSLEKLYTYSRFLLSKLPKADYAERLKLDNEIALEYYRLQKVGEGALVLEIQGEHSLDPTTEAGISRDKEEREKLSNIIQVLNTKYNTDFTDADKLFFASIEEELYADKELMMRAQNNPISSFKYAFEEVFVNKLIERMDANQDIFDKIMENSEFKNDVKDWLTQKIYKRFNNQNSTADDEGR